jgi:hypothetical protein
MKFKARKFDFENAKWKCVWHVSEPEDEFYNFLKTHEPIYCQHCNKTIIPGNEIVSAFERDESSLFYCSYQCFAKDYGACEASLMDEDENYRQLYREAFPIRRD